LSESELPFGLSVYDASFHQGVVGIVASRIRERYHRPTIVFADAGEGELKGSGRSIEGVHIRDILDRVAATRPGLIAKFGGHAMAAGLSLERENYNAFVSAFNDAVAEALHHKPPEPLIETDGELELGDMQISVADGLLTAGPWGQQFPAPVFDGRFTLRNQRLLKDKHLKMTLEASGTVFDAIAFNVDVERWPDPAVSEVGVVYTLDINEYRGERRLQLLVSSLWPCSS